VHQKQIEIKENSFVGLKLLKYENQAKEKNRITLMGPIQYLIG